VNEDYIDLDRKFRDIAIENNQLEEFDYALLGLESGISWDDLYKDKIVVVRGTPGIGKTVEFKSNVKKLIQQDKYGFYIPLPTLAASNYLENILESTEANKRFDDWKKSDDEGFFFLDSLDEARLKSSFDFGVALRRIAQRLSSDATRSKIFISCRLNDWDESIDHKIVASSFEILSLSLKRHKPSTTSASEMTSHDTGQELEQSDSAEKFKIRCVSLLPLNKKQIAKLASSYGVADPDNLVEELEENDLISCANNPLDLKWIAAFWKAHKKLGTYSEMIELSIMKRLREWKIPPQKPFPISLKQACAGAEDLAAAVVLGLFSNIIIPGRIDELDSLSPQEALPEWTDFEIIELLDRRLFDEATAGRVRFDNRRTREYLAASWMSRLIEAGCPPQRILEVFLKKFSGKDVIVPGFEGLLGWLTNYNRTILDNTVKIAPEIVLSFGDANRIPVEIRMQALRNLSKKLAKEGRLSYIIDSSDYRRVTDPKMARGIIKLGNEYSDNEDVLTELLYLVQWGKLTECAKWVFSIFSKSKNDRIRANAIYAIGHAGNTKQKRAIRKYILRSQNISVSICGAVIGALFPKNLSIPNLKKIIQKKVPYSDDSTSGIPGAINFFVVPKCPTEKLSLLIDMCLSLARTKPLSEDSLKRPSISQDYRWLSGTFCLIINRFLIEFPSQTIPWNKLKTAFIYIHQQQSSSLYIPEIEELRENIELNARAKRAFFWAIIEEEKKFNSSRSHFFDSLFTLTISDFDWLIDDLCHSKSDNDIKTLLDELRLLWISGNRPKVEENKINAVFESGILSPKIVDEYKEWSAPPKLNQHQIEHRQEREKTKKRQQKEIEEEIEKAKRMLHENLEKIKAGEHFSLLFYLWHQMVKAREGGSSRWAKRDWQSLVKKFDEKIANAAREGFKKVWINWTPPLPYTRTGSQVENGVIVGLTGIAIAIDDGLDIKTLSQEEAKIAASYAFREMNGFPEWFNELANAYPEIVRGLLEKQLTEEFASEEETDSSLQDIKYASTTISDMAAPIILKLFEDGGPKRQNLEGKALEALLASPSLDVDRFNNVAKKQADDLSEKNEITELVNWISAWLQVNGKPAWEWVENYLRAKEETPNPLIIKLAANLEYSSKYGRKELKTIFNSVEILQKMIPVFYSHIKIADDIPHRTGVYSPTERDDAQGFRGKLPTILADIRGEEAHEAICSIIDATQDPQMKKWLLSLSRKQAAKSVSHKPWTPSHVAEFSKTFEKEPNTADELFQIACYRLTDIKNDVEKGDFSERELLSKTFDEKELQVWLAGRLMRESRRRYNVVREPEVDLKKKPDIRLENNKAGVVSIEIKPVGGKFRYTFDSLKRTLNDQLVNQYLRAVNSRHGILAVIMVARKSWRPLGEGRLNFMQLIQKLNEYAKEIQANNIEVEQLKVIGIDCTEKINES
jgi:hypothetical protein